MPTAPGTSRRRPDAGHRAGVQLLLPVPPADDLPETPELTRRAALALRRAVDFALDRGDRTVTSAHLMLGLLSQPGSAADAILARHEIGATRLSSQIMALLPPARDRHGSTAPNDSTELEMCRRMAADAALAVGAPAVTTGHLLAAVLSNGDSRPARLLLQLGLSTRGVRAINRHRQGRPGSRRPVSSAGGADARTHAKKRYPATTYSPTPLPGKYHRRWRA